MNKGKINAKEYKTISDCILAMWMDNRFTDTEYSKLMDKINDYAESCGVKDNSIH